MGNGCCQAKNLDKDSETVFKITQPSSTSEQIKPVDGNVKTDTTAAAAVSSAIKSEYTPLTVTNSSVKAEPSRVVSPAPGTFTTSYSPFANPTGGYYYAPVAHVVQTGLPPATVIAPATTTTTSVAAQGQTHSYNPLQQRGLFSSGQKGMS